MFHGRPRQPGILLTTGKIPEYDGYELICCIKSIPDVVQMTIDGEGEVVPNDHIHAA